MLISAILRTQNHTLPAARGINPNMFYGYREEYEWIERYVMKYLRTPSVGAFRKVFDDLPVEKVDDVELYTEEVREAHARQVVLKELNKITSKLKSGDVVGAIQQLSSAALSSEASLLGHGTDGDIFRDNEDVKEEILRRAEKADETGFSGIPTGFPTLDELTGGIQPGWFVVISARAGVGKTRSLIRMACAAAFSGYTVQYDALEQTRPEIGMQVHSFASSEFGHSVLKSLDLAQGKVDKQNYLKFLRSMKETIQGKMHVADNSRNAITPSTMAAQIERNQADIVFLDYLTIMEGADGHENAAALSKSMARTAKHYRTPIITAAQINRSGAERKEQGLEHLSDTDELGRSADLVINVQQYSKRVLSMTVVKFRHGPSGHKFYLKFDPNMGVMEEITWDDAQNLRDVDEDKKNGVSRAKFVPRKKGSFHESALTRKQQTASEPQSATEKAVRHANGHKVVPGPARAAKRPVRIKRVS